MDYTLIEYDMDSWEGKAYRYGLQTLRELGFPCEGLRFDSHLVIRGLILDTELGNLVKVGGAGARVPGVLLPPAGGPRGAAKLPGHMPARASVHAAAAAVTATATVAAATAAAAAAAVGLDCPAPRAPACRPTGLGL